MGAAFCCRDGVAIGMHKPVGVAEAGGAPQHRPFDIAVAAIFLTFYLAGENVIGHSRFGAGERL